MRLSAQQIDNVLSRLPRPSSYRGRFIKIDIREPLGPIKPEDGGIVCKAMFRFIEFEKSEDGQEWLLASMPQY